MLGHPCYHICSSSDLTWVAVSSRTITLVNLSISSYAMGIDLLTKLSASFFCDWLLFSFYQNSPILVFYYYKVEIDGLIFLKF